MNLINYDMLIFFHPSLACTFDCVYCGQHSNTIEPPGEIEIKKIMKRLDEFKKTLLVCICGGEPFLIPNLTEFVYELTKRHYVRIDTNLSQIEKCREFMNIINPDRVIEIVFSTHILEREKRKIDLLELVSLVKELQKKGFNIFGNYVAYPPLLSRMERDLDFLNSQGIKVIPILFQGTFNGKKYPLQDGRPSYSEEELELIARLNPYAIIPFNNPRNEFCQAGCTAFCINDKYKVFPCLTMMYHNRNKLGDFYGKWRIFPKVIRCPECYCSDQYNKNFVSTLGNTGLNYLFLKTVSEKGICSRAESFLLLSGYWKDLLPQKIKEAIRRLLARRHRPKEKHTGS